MGQRSGNDANLNNDDTHQHQGVVKRGTIKQWNTRLELTAHAATPSSNTNNIDFNTPALMCLAECWQQQQQQQQIQHMLARTAVVGTDSSRPQAQCSTRMDTDGQHKSCMQCMDREEIALLLYIQRAQTLMNGDINRYSTCSTARRDCRSTWQQQSREGTTVHLFGTARRRDRMSTYVARWQKEKRETCSPAICLVKGSNISIWKCGTPAKQPFAAT